MLTIGANEAAKHQNQMINSDFGFIRNGFIIIINIINIVIVVTYAESKVNIAVKFNVGFGSLPPPHLNSLPTAKVFDIVPKYRFYLVFTTYYYYSRTAMHKHPKETRK